MTDRYTLVSADCHAGADLHTYRDYLESSYTTTSMPAADFEPVEDLTDESKIRNWDNEVRHGNSRPTSLAAIVFPNTIPPFFPGLLCPDLPHR